MAEATTYLAVTKDDLRDVIQELMPPTIDPMLDLKGVDMAFGFKKAFVYTLVKEGRIKQHPVDGHPKMVRYRYSELLSVFNSLNQ